MRLASALALTLASATLASAAAPTKTALPSRQRASDSGVTLHVTTRETIVDVTVTDKDGNPVHGLKREDFTIKEDGKPQPVRSFNEFGTQPTVQPASHPKLPPNVYTNLQPPASGPINILFLDRVTTAPDSDCAFSRVDSVGQLCPDKSIEIQHLVRQEVVKYIQTMPASTRLILLAADNKGLHILQGLSSDRELLIASVNTLQPVTEPIGGKDRIAVELMNQIASIATTVNGKKNLIWFNYGLSSFNQPEICRCDDAPFLRASSNLTEAQVTVYPIGARGVYNGGVKQLFISGEVLSQEAIAEAGGGIAYHDSNDLKTGIAKAIEAGSNYYTITYPTPDKEYDGRHHSISVHLNSDHPGVHLTYRNYYYSEDPSKLPKPQFALAPTPTASPNPVESQAHMMARGAPASTALLFDVKVDTSTEPRLPSDPSVAGFLDPKLAKQIKDKPLTRYGVLFALPSSQIAFADDKGSLEFDVVAYDSTGKPITSLSKVMSLPLTPEEHRQLLNQPFQFFEQLDLPPGPAFLRIGIHDLTSNKIGTIEVPLTVPKTPPDRAANQPTPPTK